MFRKPVFWVAFVVAALVGVAVAVHLFPAAMPFVTLDLEMDRDAALEEARDLAARRGWGPEGYRQAAAFRSSEMVQAYVELEGGGNTAFARMLRGGLYRPYTWQVRHFREHEPNETLVRFTPEGEPYGFGEKLAEDAPGAALDEPEARRIAETAAVGVWGVDLASFTPLEASRETQPGGRVDHTFVYERPDAGRLADERYRLRLVVSGDRFTELTHFVKVPEAFERRFEEMRSKNSLVAGVSSGVVLVLYGGGAILGLFLLLRKRWVVWKPALYLAGAIAILIAGAFLAQWPLQWMEYDTAVSAASFAAQRIIYSILNGLFLGILALVALVAGESLTRRAFPRHPQLWELWSADGARSREVLGATVGAFLLVGVMLAYLSLIYAFARAHLGWWLPSASLTDPNVVASFLPWLFPLAISLQAGVVEEVVFRAIPLAGAVLLGRRFGGQRFWVAGALLLQAIVFGAVHADYPAQPAWARLVEIAIPFVFIGAIYLVFGLLPAIVMHFAFDVVMFSLPLFASSAPGVWLDRALVVVLTLVPLWIVLYARWRHGSWTDLPDGLRNEGWSPPVAAEEPPPTLEAPAARPTLAPRTAMGLAAAGTLGLLLWGGFTRFHADAPPVDLTKASAVAAARAALEKQGVTLDDSWRALPSVAGGVGPADLFVWQEGGPETYRSVIGSHIEAPHWQVRRARFEGDVVERAEEYLVHVDSEGRPFRVRHLLPEGRPGESLSRDEARDLAAVAIGSALDLDAAALREVSAEPSERPERRDWTFTFEDPAVSVGGAGEARVAVALAGDEVVDVFRHVHVPEEWQRAAQERYALEALVANVCGVPVGLGLLAAAVAGLVGWSRGRFARATFVVAFVGLAAVLILRGLNGWPVQSAGFSTSQPWATQAVMGVGAGMVGSVFLAAFLGLGAGFAHRRLPPGVPTARATTLWRGAALGTVWAGLAAVVSAVSPSVAPLWGSLMGAGTALPWIAASLEILRGWAMQTLLLLLLVGLARALSRGGGARRVASSLLLIASGPILYGAGGVQPLSAWVITGLATGLTLWLSYALVLRFQPTLVPLATAVLALFTLAREAALGAYPGARTGAVLAMVVLGAVGLWWTTRLERDSRASAGPPVTTA